jgi:hypothetical protein
MKVIVPVGVPGLVDVTVAVNVTGCPRIEGFTEETIVGAVGAPVDAIASPLAGMVSGLPGADVVT